VNIMLRSKAGGQNSLMFSAAGMLLAATLSGQSTAVTAHDAWARTPAPSKMETAAYMVIENHTGQPRAVVAVSSNAADKVEMHQMKMMDGKAGDKTSTMPGMAKKSMMVMTPVAQIPVPANGKATLEPNGLHIMLFGLKSKLADGDTVALTLKLDDGTTVPVTAAVHK
jgi:periplasmic copper chaperone A